jgi:hypothetical protein
MIKTIPIMQRGDAIGSISLPEETLKRIAEMAVTLHCGCLLCPSVHSTHEKLIISEFDIENVIDDSSDIENKAAKLEEENAQLKKALASVITLMNHSEGVAGLHLNGNVATWDELLAGDEAWLTDFRKAEAHALIDDTIERDKNAALIAAAPELLAVVIEFVNGCDKAGIQDFNIKYLADARAAIAKAIPNAELTGRRPEGS